MLPISIIYLFIVLEAYLHVSSIFLDVMFHFFHFHFNAFFNLFILLQFPTGHVIYWKDDWSAYKYLRPPHTMQCSFISRVIQEHKTNLLYDIKQRAFICSLGSKFTSGLTDFTFLHLLNIIIQCIAHVEYVCC